MTSIQQDDSPIVEYYSRLKRVWDELQSIERFHDCTCGALISYLKSVLLHLWQCSGERRDYKKYKVDKSDRKCDYCKKIGHTMHSVYSLAMFQNGLQNSKSKQPNRGSSSKVTAHVFEVQTVGDFVANNPLDYNANSSQKEVEVDASIVNAVYKEMMKLMKNQSSVTDYS